MDDLTTEFADDAARAAWAATLPEGVREWQEVTTAKSPAAFFDQMGNLRSLQGRSLVFPTEDASPEQLNDFYGKVVERGQGRLAIIPSEGDEAGQAAWRKQQGIPDEASAYEFPTDLENVPPDLLSPERAEALRGLAHKHGLPAAKFKAMAGDLLTLDAQALTQAQEAAKAAQGELKDEWGDAYDQRYQRVATFLERDGAPPELIQAAHGKSLGPRTAKYLFSVSERMGGEAGEISRQTGGERTDDVSDAQQRIDEIMAQDGTDGNAKHPYWDPSHPRHAAALQQMITLQAKANPKAQRTAPSRAGLPAALTS